MFEQLSFGHLIVALATAAVVAIPAWLARRRASKTHRELDAAMRQFSRGNFSTEVQSSARGSLGELVRGYNETAHTLSEAREKLANYQRALEERVRERTRDLNAATARAIHVAQTDPLTLLPNRILLTQRLDEAIRRAAADTTRVSVLFIDLDLFKTFNDTLGHETGDSVLRTAAQRIKSAVRSEDIVARFGGDEFVVLLSRLDFQRADSTTLSVAEDILGALNQPLDIAGSRITLPASIGVACYPQDGRTAADLIKNADSAMYAAKQGGGGRISRFADESGQLVLGRSKLDADIRRGVAAEEFFLVFQPQIELSTGMPAGLEALMRWRHPTRGVVSPLEFIPAAEQSGLIHQLGQRALEMACEQFKFWQQLDVHPRISVNVSAKQMENSMWLESVRDVIDATGIPPQFLDLEITESMLVNNPEQIVETLGELNRLGVTLTLDDFGTGYSSLSYLTRLPFQTIKIDRSFIHEIEIPARRSIVQAIVAVAHSLGMRVIAEGIESPLQLTILRELGCEEAQGFYIAKPCEVAAIAPWWTTQVAGVRHTLERR
ncbi:MAG: EAL domain-containing protein [Betaproteobacteria bacterium]|nr:MAG: EAL domain-containing protein [Betaproteobacteria bacterium]TAG47164.1 MAG: EAL domain-containing protein [Betaproteobacteria bacterium]